LPTCQSTVTEWVEPMTHEEFNRLYALLENEERVRRVDCLSTATCKGWSAQEKEELLQANKDQLRELHPVASVRIAHLLARLEEQEDTFVRLSSPVKTGHSIRFEIVAGSSKAVARLAKSENLSVEENILVVPLDSKSPDLESGSKKAEAKWSKPAQGADIKYENVVEKELSSDDKENLASTNGGAVSAGCHLSRVMHTACCGRKLILLFLSYLHLRCNGCHIWRAPS